MMLLNSVHLPCTMASRSLSLLRRQCWLASRRLCSVQASSSPAVHVQDERVQTLLSQLTGLDLDKVFTPRKEPLQLPTYKLMTMEELEKVKFSSYFVYMCMILQEAFDICCHDSMKYSRKWSSAIACIIP